MSTRGDDVFELTGRMLTVSILRVLDADLDQLLPALAAHVEAAPAFFDGMPVVIDAAGVAESGLPKLWLSELAQHLWQHGVVPVGVVAGDPHLEALAAEAGLGVLRRPGGRASRGATGAGPGEAALGRSAEGEPRSADDASADATAAAPEPEVAETASGRIVTQPVRSGQQIYARGGDLVVLAGVSAGAEVLADGNVHVYGNLRGRALAGVQGDRGARIFCRQLNAELLAVAGCYQVSDQLDERLRGKAVQVWLDGDALHIEAMDNG